MLAWYGSNGAHQGNHKLEELIRIFYWCRNVAWSTLLFVICFSCFNNFFVILFLKQHFLYVDQTRQHLDMSVFLLLPFTSSWKFHCIVSSWNVMLSVQCPWFPWNTSPDFNLHLISWIIYSDFFYYFVVFEAEKCVMTYLCLIICQKLNISKLLCFINFFFLVLMICWSSWKC